MRTDRTAARPTARQIADGLGALCVVTAGLVGIPTVLAVVVGWPLPHHVPTTGQISTALQSPIPDTFWPYLFATLTWIAWAYFAFSVLTNLFTQVRARRRHGSVRFGAHGMAGALITAIMVGS